MPLAISNNRELGLWKIFFEFWRSGRPPRRGGGIAREVDRTFLREIKTLINLTHVLGFPHI
jgi:hypothetical protein